jgi:hypothetical protein
MCSLVVGNVFSVIPKLIQSFSTNENLSDIDQESSQRVLMDVFFVSLLLESHFNFVKHEKVRGYQKEKK